MAPIPKTQLAFLVRRMHVSTRRRDIVREIYRRLRRLSPMPSKSFRKRCYRYAINIHLGETRMVKLWRL